MKKTTLSKLALLHLLSVMAVFASSVLFASCRQPDNITNITNYTVYKDAEEESYDFTSEALPVYDGRYSLDSPSALMFVRFYDGNKYIPYVSFQYYLETFSDIIISKSSYAGNKYKYYGSKTYDRSFDIIVDTKKDTIYCPDLECFLIPDSENNKNSELVSNITGKLMMALQFFKGQKAITFDLHKYGFKIYESTDDAYLPLCVMNQIFSCFEYANYYFNGEAVYYFDVNKDFFYKSFQNSSWYKNENDNIAERPKELIDATYNLFCFTHEYLYGHPGYYGFADTEKNGYADAEIVKKADAMSLDEILNTYAPDVKTQLISSSYKDYILGLRALFYYVYGDVHTTVTNFIYYIFDKDTGYDIYKNTKTSPKVIRINNLDGSTPISTIRENSGKSEGLELLSDGKTAVIRFDEFIQDAKGWESFYDSNSDAEPNPEIVTIPDDTFGFVYKSFYTLLNDAAYKDVKNVIIDVSCNVGGVTRTVYYFISYLIGPFYSYDGGVNTNIKNVYKYIGIDSNLDGNIDEEDDKYRKKVQDKFKFAVLTSFASFSSANLFPCLCAEAGIPIIGERSGGGSCALISGATADGFPYFYSRPVRFEYADGTSFEYGAPITIEMPYEDFYNDEKLIAVMEKLYGKED